MFISLCLFLIFFIFLSGLMVFCSMRKHILLTLLSLEFLVLGLFLLFYLFLFYYDSMMFMNLVFLTFSVCEGALGLGILVSMIRSHGNDSIFSLSSVLW
uniref:NADH-ubiquinone oxidoreductase chain 4L n=1 Tax=Neocentrocnemis stali TaxID=888042 RepID=A0A7I6H8D4_9HEMI|nr:NADH dehydrogenase subunit 4L [Neocentrocnemis stali]AGO28035.1 NADH dehydrogenase subunit 4L [Neocentrocnemis stali]